MDLTFFRLRAAEGASPYRWHVADAEWGPNRAGTYRGVDGYRTPGLRAVGHADRLPRGAGDRLCGNCARVVAAWADVEAAAQAGLAGPEQTPGR